MMLISTYSKPRRELRLGTVVFRDKRFLLCVHLYATAWGCRLEEVTSFPFLPLLPPEQDKVDFIVRHPLRDEWIPLELTRKPSGLEMLEFRPGSEGMVAAYKQGHWYYFKSESGRTSGSRNSSRSSRSV